MLKRLNYKIGHQVRQVQQLDTEKISLLLIKYSMYKAKLISFFNNHNHNINIINNKL